MTLADQLREPRKAFELWRNPQDLPEQAPDRLIRLYAEKAWNAALEWQRQNSISAMEAQACPSVDETALGELACKLIDAAQEHIASGRTPLRTAFCRILRPYVSPSKEPVSEEEAIEVMRPATASVVCDLVECDDRLTPIAKAIYRQLQSAVYGIYGRDTRNE